MRLICELKVTSQGANAAKGKSNRCTLVLFKSNPSGSKICLETVKANVREVYNVTNNIGQIFHKFVHEGKCTIRFKQPNVDLAIAKADEIQLRSFLHVLNKAGRSCEITDIHLPSGSDAGGTKSKPPPPTNLVISEPKHIPIFTNYSSLVKSVTISDCSLKKVDKRLLSLRYLEQLDLSRNQISTLPACKEADLPRLKRLTMNDNLLQYLPLTFFQEKLRRRLECLQVSHNKLRCADVCVLMSELRVLDLSGNDICRLPLDIGHDLPHLQSLNISNNRRLCLPSSLVVDAAFTDIAHMLKTKLQTNPFDFKSIPTADISHIARPEDIADLGQPEYGDIFPTLVDIAAGVVRSSGQVLCELACPNHLIRYVRSGERCSACARYQFPRRALRLWRPLALRGAPNCSLTKTAPALPVELVCCHRCLRRAPPIPYGTSFTPPTSPSDSHQH